MTALVIGESLVDVVDVPGEALRRTPGGGPLNVAIGLSSLGVSTTFLTSIGADADGDLLKTAIDRAGVLLTGRRRGRTSTAYAKVGSDGSAIYEFSLDWDPQPAGDARFDQPLDALHVGSIGAFVYPGRDVVDHYLRQQVTFLRSFDPNIRPSLVGPRWEARARVESIAKQVDIVKLSDEDASWLYPEADPADVIARLHSLGAQLVALTKGAAGSIISTGRHQLEIPAPRVHVVDTIGAGDAYLSSFLGALILNRVTRPGLADLAPDVLFDIGAMASRAAAFVVARAGARPPTFEDLRDRR